MSEEIHRVTYKRIPEQSRELKEVMDKNAYREISLKTFEVVS